MLQRSVVTELSYGAQRPIFFLRALHSKTRPTKVNRAFNIELWINSAELKLNERLRLVLNLYSLVLPTFAFGTVLYYNLEISRDLTYKYLFSFIIRSRPKPSN